MWGSKMDAEVPLQGATRSSVYMSRSDSVCLFAQPQSCPFWV